MNTVSPICFSPRSRPAVAALARAVCLVAGLSMIAGCVEGPEVCVWQDEGRPEVLFSLGCRDDHEVLAGQPESAALPASRSVLFLIDRTDDNKIHFRKKS